MSEKNANTERNEELKNYGVDTKLAAAAIDIDLTLNALGSKLLENDEKKLKVLNEINENTMKTNERIKKLTEAMLMFVDALNNKIED